MPFRLKLEGAVWQEPVGGGLVGGGLAGGGLVGGVMVFSPKKPMA